MNAGRARVVACRLPVVAFWVTTAVYGLLAYVPFTYHQVIEFRLVPGLDLFARLHPWLALAALGLAVCSLLDELRHGPQGLAVGFVVVNALATAFLIVNPVLAALGNSSNALVLAGGALVPLLWLALIDWISAGADLEWRGPAPGEDGRLVWATLAAGVSVAVLAAAILMVRLAGEMPVPWPALGLAWAFSLVYHLLAFTAVAAVLLAVRGLSAFAGRGALAEFILVMAAAVAVLAFIVNRLALSAVSLTGTLALAISVAFSAGLVASVSGLALRLWPRERVVESGLELAGRLFGASVSPLWSPVMLVCVGLLGYGTTASAAAMDWNYLLQQLAALCVWLGVFALFHGAVRPCMSRTAAALTLVGVAGVSLGGYRALHAFQGPVSQALTGTATDVASVLDRYAGYDASFRFLHDRLRVEPVRSEASMDLFPLLQRHTNIPRTVPVDLPDLQMAGTLTPGQLPRPHIFVIVIDSLRPDYLAPYNAGVTFTPALDAFARDSHVFTRAFSRYGATGLAEPSIWVGGLIPHQQYPASFSRLNALQKLVAAEGYTGFVSMDTILRATVEPWPGMNELDAGRPNKDYRLCTTLEELGSRLRKRPPGAADPVFVYTQPQDIHISAITREGKTVLDAGDYSGFYPPYASRMRRMDGCFGGFIQTLKDTGIYDTSIIVFTSDHGDSLGEEGRWGHAYTVFPEVVRVPLIVHLPPSMRTLSVDTSAVTFTTDLTPSFYYLLGHRPTMNQPLFGGPLFTENPAERRPYLRDSYIVASSYGPVYGWINDRGRSLYILDAASYRDHAYTLGPGVAGTSIAVSADLRLRGGRQIQAAIQEIARFYRIPLDH